MNVNDALRAGVGRATWRVGAAIQRHPAGIGRECSAENIQQCALACPVLTDERMHFATIYCKVNAAKRRGGATDKTAIKYLNSLFHHVVSQDKSAREALQTFLSGRGDVLLTYESEALNSRLVGTDIPYVIPRQTMLIQLPIAVLKNSPNLDLANRFIRFTKTDGPQDLLAQYGFRPVNPTVAKRYADKYPTRPGIFKIDDKYIGGWRNADKVWFDPNKGRMAAIERAVGGPTSG